MESQKIYQQQGLELVSSTPGEFAKFLRSEVAQYEQAVRKHRRLRSAETRPQRPDVGPRAAGTKRTDGRLKSHA